MTSKKHLKKRIAGKEQSHLMRKTKEFMRVTKVATAAGVAEHLKRDLANYEGDPVHHARRLLSKVSADPTDLHAVIPVPFQPIWVWRDEYRKESVEHQVFIDQQSTGKATLVAVAHDEFRAQYPNRAIEAAEIIRQSDNSITLKTGAEILDPSRRIHRFRKTA